MAYDPNLSVNDIEQLYSGAKPIYGNGVGVISGYELSPQTRSYFAAKQNAVSQTGPQQNAQGVWIDPTTGTPFHGTYKDPVSGVQHYYSNGKSVPTVADVGLQTPIYNETTTARQPQINAAADTALATSTATSAETAKGFADYLAQAKALNAQGADQLKKDQAAVDPTATVARVNADTAATTSALKATNRDYAAQQQGVQQQVVQENTDYAKQVQDRLDALAAENTNYESKAQAVADQAFNAAKAGISLYQMGSGTPTSGSGNLSNRYIRSYAAINTPLQAQLSQNRSNLINLGRQTDQQLYQNKLSELSGQAALNTDLANRDTDTTKYTGNLDTNTAQYIQQIMTATAGMSRQMAAQYLQQLQIPFDVGQHILSGDIQNLSGIQSLYNGANWYSVSQPYTGANVPATPAYDVQPPGGYGPRNYGPSITGTGGANPPAPDNPNAAYFASREYKATQPVYGSYPNVPTKYLSGQSTGDLADQGLMDIGGGMFADPMTGATYDASGNQIPQPAGT